MQGLDWEKEEESVEKYYFEEEWKEAVLLTKENKSTVLVLDGEEVEICCPETVRGNVSECGTPCLVLESKYPKDGNYEAMALYEKIKGYAPEMVIMDAGYRTPAIAHELLTDGILPLLPYKRPMTKDGFFKKYEYVYDEYYDCYICPEGQILTYCTTDREGYREYKSCGTHCAHCPGLGRCTHSKSHVKTVTRHVWEEYMETVEDIRHTRGNREIYARRKETIERIFGTAKEQHGFRYTQYIGRARMEMKAGLTFACMDLKKLARILARKGAKRTTVQGMSTYFKEDISHDKRAVLEFCSDTSLCLQSEVCFKAHLPIRCFPGNALFTAFLRASAIQRSAISEPVV